MNHRIVLRGIFVLGLGLLLSAGAQAQAFRTYLSGSGNDANPCTLAAPCRLLPRAIATVIDGGEIWMLNSANYNTGTVNVNKSVTILAVPGALGSVVGIGDAIDIDTPGVKVALRNLVIVPYVGGGDAHGILMTAGASLTLAKCLIANLRLSGVFVTANGASVLVMDTVIRGNGEDGLQVRDGAHATVTRATISANIFGKGVRAAGTIAGTTTTVDIADSTIGSNDYGVYAVSLNESAYVKVSVRDSQVVQNSTDGLSAVSSFSAPVTLSASNNVISNNDVGVHAMAPGAKVWASGNTVSDNGWGLYNDAEALIESAGDNAVRNNTFDTYGTISPAAEM